MELKNIHTGEIVTAEGYQASKMLGSGNYEEVKQEPVKKEAKPEAEKPSAKK